MSLTACHAQAENAPPADARDLIKRVLTVRRIAQWCCVSEGAVHQWLSRGTDAAPIPAGRIPMLAAAAAREGIDFDLGLLWPALAGISARAVAAAPTTGSPSAFADAQAAHQVADRAAVQGADGHDAVPAAANPAPAPEIVQ